MIPVMLSGCFGSTVNSFCSVYTVEELYPEEQEQLEQLVNGEDVDLPIQLEQKLDNLVAHDVLDC